MSSPDNYHFGCCMACRAPFLPDLRLFSQPESQAVFWLQMRFEQIARGGTSSRFTGKKEGSHLISRAHYKYAYLFGTSIPAARINQDLEGWNRNPTMIPERLNKSTCFELRKTRYDNMVDRRADSGDAGVDPQAVDRAKRAIERERTRNRDATENELIVAMVKEITDTTVNSFVATWARPPDGVLVQHKELRKWLSASVSNGRIKPVKIDIDFTVPCCSLCNDIWDCWARMRQVLADPIMVPTNAITVDKIVSGNRTGRMQIPVPPSESRNKSVHQERLGCLVGYYMHGSLISLASRGPNAVNLDPGPVRPLASMLLWIPLHITCMKMELDNPTGATKKSKGAHNYLGNIDLLITYYQWLCALSEYTDNRELEFGKFSTMYMRELAYAPPPVWDAEAHPKLSDYIFDHDCPATDDIRARISHVSDRLVHMYLHKVKPLVPFMRGGGAVSADADPEFCLKAESYFIGERECWNLMSNYNPLANLDIANIKYFLDFAGTSAVLWQNHRYLEAENPGLVAALEEWINRKRESEYNNIAYYAYGQVTPEQAPMLYLMQYALTPTVLFPAGIELGSGAEIYLLQNIANDEIMDRVEKSGMCSTWKAVPRLKKWHSTTPSSASAEATDGSPATSTTASRFHTELSRMDANIYCAIAESFDSFKTRLISARLEITAPMSSELVVHGAGVGGCDERRRG